MDNSTDVISMECDTNSSTSIEIFLYIMQASYIIPGIILHFMILRTVLWKMKMVSANNSFYVIYTMDSIASVTILLCDISFTRLFIYVSPLCPLVSPFFFTPSIIAKISYVLPNYMKAMKSVTQIFMVINRMSCVLFPFVYTQKWKTYLPIIVMFTLLSPSLVTWNLVISRQYPMAIFGGFSIIYTKKVSWAKLSTFHLIFLTISMVITIICTSTTLYNLITLPNRIKSSERTLCLATIIISIGFSAIGITQFLYAFCASCQLSAILLTLQFICYDFLNIGSPLVIIIMNADIRKLLFNKREVSTNVVPARTSMMYNS